MVLLSVLFSSCNGFVGEIDVKKPTGAPVKIVDPDFVVLRSVKKRSDGRRICSNTGSANPLLQFR
jgi:hypothetical protein